MNHDEPRYTHDCSMCVFLGQYDEYDLYFCNPSSRFPTVIARYSNEGPDYQSGLHAAMRGNLPELTETYNRAKTQDLL